MVLVTVGTFEWPFDRLVRAAASLPRPLVVQRGTSRVEVPGARVVDLLPPSELAALLSVASLVITHGGPGSIRAALAAGLVPIVVPRRASLGEHVDDHQVAFARRMAERVHVVEDVALLPEAIARHVEVCRALRSPAVGDGEQAAARLAAAIEALRR